jgi:hypothetical protein
LAGNETTMIETIASTREGDIVTGTVETGPAKHAASTSLRLEGSAAAPGGRLEGDVPGEPHPLGASEHQIDWCFRWQRRMRRP